MKLLLPVARSYRVSFFLATLCRFIGGGRSHRRRDHHLHGACEPQEAGKAIKTIRQNNLEGLRLI